MFLLLFAAQFRASHPLRFRVSGFFAKAAPTSIDRCTQVNSSVSVQPVQKKYKSYQKLKPLPPLGKILEVPSALSQASAANQDNPHLSEAEKKRYLPPPLPPLPFLQKSNPKIREPEIIREDEVFIEPSPAGFLWNEGRGEEISETWIEELALKSELALKEALSQKHKKRPPKR